MNLTDVATRNYLLYFALPLWIVPGFLDWMWHRRTSIETTSGLRESALHNLMMMEAGVPVFLGLFAEINALVITVMIAAFFVHFATACWDVSLAVKLRHVSPTEQHIHSALEMLPFAVVSSVACLHAEQLLSIFGAGTQAPDWSLRWKDVPLAPGYTAAILASTVLFLAVAYAEEMLRCYRTVRRHAVVAEASYSRTTRPLPTPFAGRAGTPSHRIHQASSATEPPPQFH